MTGGKCMKKWWFVPAKNEIFNLFDHQNLISHLYNPTFEVEKRSWDGRRAERSSYSYRIDHSYMTERLNSKLAKCFLVFICLYDIKFRTLLDKPWSLTLYIWFYSPNTEYCLHFCFTTNHIFVNSFSLLNFLHILDS